mmetsp:Transcript_81/g.316  ORF Transcript_81/g.316 Transcript_81/m.316 type:complete len:302 (-) Transcript_81:140-1045(-)
MLPASNEGVPASESWAWGPFSPGSLWTALDAEAEPCREIGRGPSAAGSPLPGATWVVYAGVASVPSCPTIDAAAAAAAAEPAHPARPSVRARAALLARKLAISRFRETNCWNCVPREPARRSAQTSASWRRSRQMSVCSISHCDDSWRAFSRASPAAASAALARSSAARSRAIQACSRSRSRSAHFRSVSIAAAHMASTCVRSSSDSLTAAAVAMVALAIASLSCEPSASDFMGDKQASINTGECLCRTSSASACSARLVASASCAIRSRLRCASNLAVDSACAIASRSEAASCPRSLSSR